MDLQSYRHDCFSKILRTLFDFLNKTYWVSLFWRINSLIFRTVVITIANDRLPARQMTGTFLFSGRNKDRAPARQTTGTFFSGRNNDRAPARQMTRTFFSGYNNDCLPARQTTGTFLFSGRNNDRAPARQTTGIFFFRS